MKTWKVKTKGRIERFLVVFIIPVVLEFWGVDLSFLSGLGWFAWAMIIVFTAFLWIPILTVVSNKLINKKIPMQISFDEERRICEIIYSKSKIDVVPFDNLKYSYLDNSLAYNSITFYRSFIGTRGQVVNNRVTEIFGFKFSFSWNKSQVSEIHKYLKEKKISFDNGGNDNFSLWEKMLSN